MATKTYDMWGKEIQSLWQIVLGRMPSGLKVEFILVVEEFCDTEIMQEETFMSHLQHVCTKGKTA